MQRVSFYTLGCKLNQAETASLQDDFKKRGYDIVPFGEPVDICVINTCSVTARTEYKCRQVIRKAIKHSPEALIAVVGCYAQVSADRLSTIPGISLILGSDEKFEIFKYLDRKERIQKKIGVNQEFIHAQPGSYRDQTRAFLKIQDGCNNYCSYCIVPYARGRSRSAQLEKVIDNVKSLIENGFKEIVLTGVHIGKYGEDLTPVKSLIKLLERIDKIDGLGRVRLSSLEPQEIDDELIEFISNSEKTCPHFHIPLQSGDDFILDRMNRNYTVADYLKIIEKIIDKIQNPGLGTDIIVGFPGENEVHFQNTYNLIMSLPFSYLHVFTYSMRAGTRAAKFAEVVSSVKKKERSSVLIRSGKQKKHEFYSNAIGNRYQVLFEEKAGGKWMYGFTGNYIRVKTAKQHALFNQIIPVEIIAVEGEFAIAKTIV